MARHEGRKERQGLEKKHQAHWRLGMTILPGMGLFKPKIF
jgi:hypothetical protein